MNTHVHMCIMYMEQKLTSLLKKKKKMYSGTELKILTNNFPVSKILNNDRLRLLISPWHAMVSWRKLRKLYGTVRG